MTITEIHGKATIAMGYDMPFDPVRKAENDYQDRICNPYQECCGCDREYLWEREGVEVYGDGYCTHCAEEEDKIFRCRNCGKWHRSDRCDADEVKTKCCDSICMAERIVALEAAMGGVHRELMNPDRDLLLIYEIVKAGLKGKQ